MKELCQGRILIVDDDPRFGAELEKTFGSRGFIVKTARGKEQELLGSARQMVQDFRPHVTIMDLRLLTGPQHRADLSGKDLLDEPDFALTRCVVYSAHLGDDHFLARELKEKPNVDDVVGRQEFERLVSAVQNSFTKGCACRKEYKVNWPVAWDHVSITDALFGSESGVPADIIFDVMGRLLWKGGRLQLSTLEGAATMTSVARGHSVLLRASMGKMPFVIKLAPRDRILKEVYAYEQYIDEVLGGHFYVQSKYNCIFWDVGAIHYSFIGSSPEPCMTLAAFYRVATNPEAILKPLRHFFEEVWHPHYTNSRSKLDESLFDAYDQNFNLRKRLDELRPDEWTSIFPGAPPELPDPIKWTLKHERDSGTFTSYQAVTHGDLHGDNLFIEGDHAWAIDFERSGPGPILRDFVELEQDIITRLMSYPEESYDAFFQFALELTKPRAVQDQLRVPPHLSARPDMVKACAVIAGLRNMAVKVTGFNDLREYYWGLLLDALLGSSLVDKESPQRKRSMLLAAVISSRLENWNKQWPPEWALRGHLWGGAGERVPSVPQTKETQQSPPHYDVFLSYNHEDLDIVNDLVQRLRDSGVVVWYAGDLIPGDDWFKIVEDRLKQSKTCVICYGPSGMGDWQKREESFALDYHFNKKLRAIPLMLPGCENKEEMGLAKLTQACDFSEGLNNEEEFQRLLIGIRSLK